MRKSLTRKQSLFIACALILALSCISVPAAMAYFSDYDRGAGRVQVRMTWQSELHEKVTDGNEHVTVSNTGQTDVLVRVRAFAGDFIKVTDTDNKWHEQDGWWYYDGILGAGQKTEELLVEVKTGMAPEDDFEVIVVHESVRTAYESNDQLAAPEGWDYVPDLKGGSL